MRCRGEAEADVDVGDPLRGGLARERELAEADVVFGMLGRERREELGRVDHRGGAEEAELGGSTGAARERLAHALDLRDRVEDRLRLLEQLLARGRQGD